MLWLSKPKFVTMRLIEFTSGRLVASVKYPQADLPDTLETTTRYVHSDDEWQVLDARPLTREECIKLGSVDLIVRHPPTGSAELPFLEPTVCATRAVVQPGSSKTGVRRYQVLPDDWRQVELVSISHQLEINKAFTEIERVITESAIEGGFAERYSRLAPAQAIDDSSPFTLDELLAIFPDGVDSQDGLTYLGEPGLIDGGFAFISSSLTQYYGYVKGKHVAALCIGGVGTHDYESVEVQQLADFAFEQNLTLIEWPTKTQRNPDSDEFFQFFDTGLETDETAPV